MKFIYLSRVVISSFSIARWESRVAFRLAFRFLIVTTSVARVSRWYKSRRAVIRMPAVLSRAPDMLVMFDRFYSVEIVSR